MEQLKAQLTTRLLAKEGEELKVYKCSRGYLTIGVGRNLETNGITREESRYLLNNDIDRCIKGVLSNINTTHCNEARLAVLVEMAFNMGVSGLLNFKQFIRCVEQGDFEQAPYHMLDSVWHKERQVGDRSIELAEQMARGEWVA
jgi:lysozyme